MSEAQAAYRLEIEPLDLGPEVRAIGLELVGSETREPVEGEEAAALWAALLPVLAGGEPWVLDFVAHLERVREFCLHRGIPFREALPNGAGPNRHVLVIEHPPADELAALLGRFAGETFGLRAGPPLLSGDAATESGLAHHGIDAYQAAWPRYLFCAVCDFENGFLTLLSERLWASEVIRRARAALQDSGVEVSRPA